MTARLSEDVIVTKSVCCFSLKIGMTMKMVNGQHQPLPIPSTRAHGSKRFVVSWYKL